MARRGPVAQKDLKVYPVDEYPYMVAKKHGDPRYFRTFREARQSMLDDVASLRYSLVERLGDRDAERQLDALQYLIEQMSDKGGTLSHVVDPYSGVRYQADLHPRGLEA